MARGIPASALVAALIVVSAGRGQACDGAGVITRIDGRPEDIVITRIESGVRSVVSRPRVLEVVCRGDLVQVRGPTTLLIEIDGTGTVRIDHSTSYNVTRTGPPSMAGNAYRLLAAQIVPDMKRLPWDAILRDGNGTFSFAVAVLFSGGQQVHVGERDLLVRLVGGTSPYKIEIRNEQSSIVASTTSVDREVVLHDVALNEGAYRISATDSASHAINASLMAVNVAPPMDSTFADLSDPEVRSAVEALTMARADPTKWSFEAEQHLQAAQANGLDRARVYELVEAYGGN